LIEKANMITSYEIGEEQSIYSQLKEILEIKNYIIPFGNYYLVAEFETKTAD
jgi:hypothetical protein